MSTRPVRISDLTGLAASAVRTARGGTPVSVTSRGQVVARIVSVEAIGALQLDGLIVTGTGTGFQIPGRVARMREGTITDQLLEDRQ
jgi:antitoxin (DNA-binding transcriptional repressor) of toxin-antitoxin stability system